MTGEASRILSHVPNSGIVQMPGRRFPGIVMQGDTLSNVFDAVVFALDDAKARRDEDAYYELLMFAETFQGQLQHYEQTLSRISMPLPYTRSINERLISDKYEDA